MQRMVRESPGSSLTLLHLQVSVVSSCTHGRGREQASNTVQYVHQEEDEDEEEKRDKERERERATERFLRQSLRKFLRENNERKEGGP